MDFSGVMANEETMRKGLNTVTNKVSLGTGAIDF